MGAGTVGIAFAQEERMASVFLDSPSPTWGTIVEELAFRGYPTFLKDAGIFAGRASGRIWWRTTPLTVPATSGTAA